MREIDPFRHHPVLSGKIKPASDSFFRNLDLADIDARVADAGFPADWRTPCEVREAERCDWFNGRWGTDLWVFGYGSLMWDPSMEFAEVRRGCTTKFARSFCLLAEFGRGSVEQPGLMLALDSGGGCEGLAFRIEAEKLDHETSILFRREMITKAYRPIWLMLETALGPIEALSFAANHGHEKIVPDIAVQEQARMIAHAEGFFGTNFDYLADMQAHLALLEINDDYVADLHARVGALRSAS